MLNHPSAPIIETNFSKQGIRQQLLIQKQKIEKEYTSLGLNRDMNVIIKPSSFSNYKNLIDILDEMAILDIKSYTVINDFTPDEKMLLQQP